jgi:hypothetical protein
VPRFCFAHHRIAILPGDAGGVRLLLLLAWLVLEQACLGLQWFVYRGDVMKMISSCRHQVNAKRLVTCSSALPRFISASRCFRATFNHLNAPSTFLLVRLLCTHLSKTALLLNTAVNLSCTPCILHIRTALYLAHSTSSCSTSVLTFTRNYISGLDCATVDIPNVLPKPLLHPTSLESDATPLQINPAAASPAL